MKPKSPNIHDQKRIANASSTETLKDLCTEFNTDLDTLKKIKETFNQTMNDPITETTYDDSFTMPKALRENVKSFDALKRGYFLYGSNWKQIKQTFGRYFSAELLKGNLSDIVKQLQTTQMKKRGYVDDELLQPVDKKKLFKIVDGEKVYIQLRGRHPQTPSNDNQQGNPSKPPSNDKHKAGEVDGRQKAYRQKKVPRRLKEPCRLNHSKTKPKKNVKGQCRSGV